MMCVVLRKRLGAFILGLLVLIGGVSFVSAALPEKVIEGRMKEAIQAYVAERLLKDPEQIDVRQISPILANQLTSLTDRITVQQGAAGVDNRGLVGRSLFLMEVTSEGASSQQWVTADVSVIRKVWVATRTVQSKEILDPSAFSEEIVYQTRLEEPYLDTETRPWGKQARRAILPGEPLMLNRIQNVPIIKRGELVTLVVAREGIRITAKGRAKENGFLGESLAVVPQGSTKVVYGTVRDAQTVEVPF